MRILITGSSGLLGRTIAELMPARHEVVGLDLVPGPCTTHRGSVVDPAAVAAAMAGVDRVIHTASLHAPDVARRSRHDFLTVNLTGTLNVLEAAAAARVRRFVYTSTTSLYGHALIPSDRTVWVTEDLLPRPRDIYDVTKLAAEHLCADFHRRERLKVICLRTGRFFPEPPHVVAVNRLSRGLDVRDAAAAHILAIENDKVPFGVYNISARSPFLESDCHDLFTDAASVISRHSPWAAASFAERGWTIPDTIDRVYVTAHAETDLGYSPRYNFASLFPNQALT